LIFREHGRTIFIADLDRLPYYWADVRHARILLRSFFSARNLLPVNEKTAWGGGFRRLSQLGTA
ncbi:hypothetical protein, partial [Escherichia coli]|uniref:hypothetical protein n=1 Tax=Escherichia coli TaxID=562 RepID=UPI001BC8B2FE